MFKLLVFVSLSLSFAAAENATDDAFGKACLEAHNKYRQAHNVAPLELDPNLVTQAQTKAQTLKPAGNGPANTPVESVTQGKGPSRRKKRESKVTSESGVNIYTDNDNDTTADEAVKMWYDAGSDYNYEVEPEPGKYDSFTQIVWKDTKKLGCVNNAGTVVAVYEPKGNVKGKYLENVLKKAGGEGKAKGGAGMKIPLQLAWYIFVTICGCLVL